MTAKTCNKKANIRTALGNERRVAKAVETGIEDLIRASVNAFRRKLAEKFDHSSGERKFAKCKMEQRMSKFEVMAAKITQ